jgi:hypothetical protein
MQYELVIEYKATTQRPTEGTLPGLRAEHSNRLVFLDLAHFLLEQVEKGFETVTNPPIHPPTQLSHRLSCWRISAHSM